MKGATRMMTTSYCRLQIAAVLPMLMAASSGSGGRLSARVCGRPCGDPYFPSSVFMFWYGRPSGSMQYNIIKEWTEEVSVEWTST